MQEQHLKVQNDLCDSLKSKSTEIDILRKDLTDLKFNSSQRISQLSEDYQQLFDTLKSTVGTTIKNLIFSIIALINILMKKVPKFMKSKSKVKLRLS